ncbi:MAG: hypothetical protein KOO61_05780 [Spirochaetales bacterium]|nr:hypothetical protein [Spirochaetales bacterium]
MKIRSKTLGVIIAVVIFGGIVGASALGLWSTAAVRNPEGRRLNESVGGTVGEDAGTGAYAPAGIRGNHQFSDISDMFGIPLETLSRAFALPANVDAATFRNQDFDTIYPEFGGEQEIGNGSMKWFVALYTGLPFELEDDEEDTYLLRPAVDILKSHADLTGEQIDYLDAYVIEIDVESEPVESNPPEDEPQAGVESDSDAEEVERKQDALVMVGKTSFADLLDWGVPAEQIRTIIGGEIPNRLMSVYDYCAQNGLSFGGIKTELQVEVDKVTP